ncbi:MAG: hypothetical protein NVV62_18060 [Terricaulis sp.]|nr:hypothetical protein [Terricaulis sp.]
MIETVLKRARMAALAGVASIGLSACLNDPEMWEGVAMGLNMAADEIAMENEYRAQCHPKNLSNVSTGNRTYPDMLCPGDYGYNAAYTQTPAYLDAYQAGADRQYHRNRQEQRDRDRRERRDRDRDRDDRREHRH